MNTRIFARFHVVRALTSFALLLALAAAQGCIFSNGEKGEIGVVRSERADLLSSTALVALKVKALKRGDKVEILKRESITGPTYTEDWLNVRLDDDEDTSGWIEARHVVSDAVVKKSAEIAGDPNGAPAIAQGRLKVNQKLRLGPGRNEDVAVTLQRGATFDIIGKKQSTYTPEKKKKTTGDTAASEEEQPDEPDTPDEPKQTDTWYQVRLPQDSIIQGGWILAMSVSLEAPDEILHLEGDGRRFVAWQTVSTVHDDKLNENRNNYVTFMRRAGAPENVDFERVYCLFWDPAAHTYYAPYVDSDLRGVFPILQREEGGKKIVTINVLNEQDRPTPVDLEVVDAGKGRTTMRRVTPPVKGERIKGR